jgi:histidine ammonia-lyase
VILNPENVSLGQLRQLWSGAEARLDDGSLKRIAEAAASVERIVAGGGTVYGVNTGFGLLANTRIPDGRLAELQTNLILSHSAGLGDPLPRHVTRLMIVLKLLGLGRGYSGVRRLVIDALQALLDRDAMPLIPAQGSVGASGDLAPLAHMTAALMGRGSIDIAGEILPAGAALQKLDMDPLQLGPKEGLALINGTHLMAACGTLALRDARRVLDAAIVTAALSLEAFMGSTTPFDARIHALRRHPGQQAVAARLRALLQGSAIVESHADCGRVQDPYTLRCVPQVLGAIADALDYAEGVLERELDAVTDNPLLFPDDGEACSGGNFHGQPLSLALDHVGLALCELASFAERRTYALLSPSYAGLPRFLTPHPGLSSGLMIAQYTQAALVNECQTLAHPAGAGSVPTSAGMEDFNSMGAWAALKARQIVDCAAHVVAIELVCACQGVEFHRPLRTTPMLEAALAGVRTRVARIEQDRSLSAEVTALAHALRSGELVLAA